ncbi:MAG: T9SS type A sorting domain-containing protein [Saprospiraceae bacterium]|nr:T9SS type A sorting domain-containing protein [Bacteroidia bacterium]NNL92368.1 T9SS type A sorting domain-containing protein [Saprospiraceae bacterium]
MRIIQLVFFIFFATNIFSQIFTEKIQIPLLDSVRESTVDFADVDGDGDLDFLMSGQAISFERISKLYINDGQGTFAEKPDKGIDGTWFGRNKFADIDGDNDMDVLVIGQNPNESFIAKLFLNDGLGNFSLKPDTPFEGIAVGSINIADLDGDSDLDILITGQNDFFKRTARLYINDGMGDYLEKTDLIFDGVYESAADVADVDGDSDLDVLIAGRNSENEYISKLYINDGSADFSLKPNTPFIGVSSGAVKFVDVEGDSDEDLIVTGYDKGLAVIVKLYLNDGFGNYSEALNTPFDGIVYGAIDIADINGNGVDDVLFSGYKYGGSITKLYLNDGSGQFKVLADSPFKGLGFGDVAFTDVNGDGRQDIYNCGGEGFFDRKSKLYINNGLVSVENNLFNINALDFTVYPNPIVNNKLNLNITEKLQGDIIINVLTSSGSTIMQDKISAVNGQNYYYVNVGDLPSGQYFIELKNKSKVGYSTFVVK